MDKKDLLHNPLHEEEPDVNSEFLNAFFKEVQTRSEAVVQKFEQKMEEHFQPSADEVIEKSEGQTVTGSISDEYYFSPVKDHLDDILEFYLPLDETEWHHVVLKNFVQHLKDQRVYDQHSGQSRQMMEQFQIGLVIAILKHHRPEWFVNVQPSSHPVSSIYLLHQKDHPVSPEGTRTLEVEIKSHAVEMQSRKLETKLSMELLEDIRESFQSMMDSVIPTIALEMVREFDVEMLQQITAHSYDPVPDKDSILDTISKCSLHTIARTKRMRVNWAIVGLEALIKINDEAKARSAEGEEIVFTGNVHSIDPDKSIQYVGDIEQYNIKVYYSPDLALTEVLLGGKRDNDIDIGLTYVPYMMFVSHGPVIHPENFTPSMNFTTRSAWYSKEDTQGCYTRFKI